MRSLHARGTALGWQEAAEWTCGCDTYAKAQEGQREMAKVRVVARTDLIMENSSSVPIIGQRALASTSCCTDCEFSSKRCSCAKVIYSPTMN